MMFYPLSEYDKYLALKVNAGMVVLGAFLLRPFWVVALALMLEKNSVEVFGFFYASQSLFLAGLASSIPVLIVLAAWARRHPDAGKLARYCWVRGGRLLWLAALANVFVALASIASYRVIPEPQLLLLVLSLYALVYAVRSKRLQAVFASYPEPEDGQIGDIGN